MTKTAFDQFEHKIIYIYIYRERERERERDNMFTTFSQHFYNKF